MHLVELILWLLLALLMGAIIGCLIGGGGRKAATPRRMEEVPGTAQALKTGGKAAEKMDEDDGAAAADAAPAPEGGDAQQEMPLLGLKEPLTGEPDNLQLISGVGPKLEKMLHEMGIYHYAQIARWDEKTIEEVDARLKFRGRITRDEWVRQAKLLAEGRMEEFERDYGSGGLKDASGKTRAGARTRRKK